jgi:ferritin-like protein
MRFGNVRPRETSNEQSSPYGTLNNTLLAQNAPSCQLQNPTNLQRLGQISACEVCPLAIDPAKHIIQVLLRSEVPRSRDL